MGWLKRVLYGLLIGIASIAPGISGGTLAIALGFYESLINAVADLLKHFKKNFLYLFPFGVGCLISIAAFSVVINFFFIKYPLPTNALFVGFIVGTLPFITGKFRSSLEGTSFGISHGITMAVFFIIVLVPVIFEIFGIGAGSGNVAVSVSPLVTVQLLGVGMIAATTLIVPGLSGTMILTAIGYYKPLLFIASTFVTALATLNFEKAFSQLAFIIPLGIGVILGIFLIAKLVSYLFRTIPAHVYSAIIGLIAATPIVMLNDIKGSDISLGSVLISILTLSIGFFLVRKVGDE